MVQMLTPTLTLNPREPPLANQSAIWPTSETSAAGKSRLYAKRAKGRYFTNIILWSLRLLYHSNLTNKLKLAF